MLGFYDSGLGGVTIFKEFISRNPGKRFVYYADTAHCPLGEKTEEEIYELTTEGVKFLFNKGCELVVLACNTATSVAIRRIQQDWLPSKPQYNKKNVLGVVRPVAEVLQEINGRKKIKSVLILATRATCRTGFYQQEFEDGGVSEHYCLACPGLAEAIEKLDRKKVEFLVGKYLTKKSKYLQNTDSVVLACTHYPIYIEQISKELEKITGHKDFKIYSQSNLVCTKLEQYLQFHKEYSLIDGDIEFYTSSEPIEFQRKLSLVFGLNYSVKSI